MNLTDIESLIKSTPTIRFTEILPTYRTASLTSFLNRAISMLKDWREGKPEEDILNSLQDAATYKQEAVSITKCTLQAILMDKFNPEEVNLFNAINTILLNLNKLLQFLPEDDFLLKCLDSILATRISLEELLYLNKLLYIKLNECVDRKSFTSTLNDQYYEVLKSFIEN